MLRACSRRRTAARRLCLLAALALPVPALATLSPAVAAPSSGVPVDGVVVQLQVRPTDGDPSALADALSADGYGVEHHGGDVVIVLGTAGSERALAARGDLTVVSAEPVMFSHAPAPASQDSVLPSRLAGREYPTFYDGYRKARGYVRFTDDLEDAYPDLVKVVRYGRTYTEENDLRVVCVTAGADRGCKPRPGADKARFLLVAQIHARELTTSEMTWRTLALLTDGYGKNADLTALLDETEIWIVPQLNPDGIEQVERGFDGADGDIWQRKNMHFEQECGTGPFSHIGVDLNRNHDLEWGGGGSSPLPCEQTYRGQSAASEPETSHFQDLVRDLFGDQRGADPEDVRGTLLTLHTYGNLSLYPFDAGTAGQDVNALRSIAFRYSHYNGYTADQANITGSTDLYTYNTSGIAALMFEIGLGTGTCSGFHPAYSCQDGFWDLNREAFLYAARLAQEPYTMAWGPNPLAARSKIKSDQRAVITATADDDAYGFVGEGRPAAQDVTAGRVFVGTAPWDGGKARAMKVIGSGTDADLKITLKRPAKDKLVWVQARDADGTWGPTRSVWLRATG